MKVITLIKLVIANGIFQLARGVPIVTMFTPIFDPFGSPKWRYTEFSFLVIQFCQ